MRKLLLPLLLALAATGRAEDLKAVANAHAKEFAAALKTKNPGWFEKYAAKDYYEVDAKGRRTDRAQAAASMKQMFAMMKEIKLDVKVAKVVPKGTGMVVTLEGNLSGAMIAPDKKRHTLKSVIRYDETWTKDGGRWKVHTQKTLSQMDVFDGKRMN